MKLKKYSSASPLRLAVKINGKDDLVEFSGTDPETGRSTFETTDADLQEQFEKSPQFKSLYQLDSETEIEEEDPNIEETDTEETGPEETGVPEFDSLPEAKKWLAQTLKIDVKKNATTEQVLDLAKENGHEIKIK